MKKSVVLLLLFLTIFTAASADAAGSKELVETAVVDGNMAYFYMFSGPEPDEYDEYKNIVIESEGATYNLNDLLNRIAMVTRDEDGMWGGRRIKKIILKKR